MLLSFAVLSLILGVTIAALGALGLVLGWAPPRGRPLLILAAGVSMLTISIVLFHLSGGRATPRVTGGILMTLCGLSMLGAAGWYGFAGVASPSLRRDALLAMAGGLLVAVVGLSLAVVSPAGPRAREHEPSSGPAAAVQRMAERRMGPVPYGVFAATILLLTNGLALRNRLDGRRIVGANLVTIALLVFLYRLGPMVFRRW